MAIYTVTPNSIQSRNSKGKYFLNYKNENKYKKAIEREREMNIKNKLVQQIMT